jgi:formylglycine-generating enzyme required for sulfatase activity
MKKQWIMMVTALLAVGISQAAFVTIGDAGNDNDTTGGRYGGVAYEYQISAQEVTISEFAASCAGDGNEDYWNDDSTTGSGRTVGINAPASKISLYEAMKYCNWLTTGDTNSGYYSNSGGGVYVANALSHNAYAIANGTTYFIPTQDEWYKAAFWTGNGYSNYANGTSTAPVKDGGTIGWNYDSANSSPNYVRDAAFGTIEQNGTLNMMGNVEEWIENSGGITRGGNFLDSSSWLGRSGSFSGFAPSYETQTVGFRPVVVIPTFVSIGYAGNVADTTGYGSVTYDYKISNHEVTIAEFAASSAGSGDEDYWNDGTRTVGINAPAVNVSLYEAMKYCNWLTTGDTNSGYYSTSDGVVYVANALSHDAYAMANGITFFVPTEDEWMKAAYWTGSDYSRYANGTSDTNNPPTKGGGTIGWNYNSVNSSISPNDTRETTLGTQEQNGTFNMMGNVYEWMEDSAGVVRGGTYSTIEFFLRSSIRLSGYSPSTESAVFGFRPVVVVPAFVSIGDAGNADDTTGYGGVAYEYKISNHEVTIAEFAASDAGDGDENFWNDGTRTVGVNAPATQVSLYEAMKYCNYLTSGNVDNGVYVFSNGIYQYTDRPSALLAYEKIYALPTEDEWYKAAYWTGSGYSDYANGNDFADGAPTKGGGETGWNYDYVNSLNSPVNYTRPTTLGSTEQNGTFNMMGNVDEWMEDSTGVGRGGRFSDTDANYLSSSARLSGYSPSNESLTIGFRPVELISTFVSIGDMGNADDTTGYGGVDYEYRIIDHEVTIAEFAESGAGNGNEDYWNDSGVGTSVGPNAPAVNVSLYEAMKYCNWLTTGNTNSGYYSTLDGGATYQANSLSHDAYAVVYGTTYFVPTEDEWVKAAYWSGSGYSLYANGTNTVPVEGGGANGWNYDYANSSPNFTRGAILGTIEQNGTVNMMGNVVEWMEDSSGISRGGSCYHGASGLISSYRYVGNSPSEENSTLGFRPVVVISTFIDISDVGNANDTTGYGSVAYEYKISSKEVTIAEFAASGAGNGDEDYWNDAGGGTSVGPNAPAVNISLYEAMKYCNWLTTGDTNSGYYSTSDGVVYVPNALSHDAYAIANGTTYFVPTEDEWYKAAYWTGNDYSLYANGTNTIPTEGGGKTGWNYNAVNSSISPNYPRDTAFGTAEQNGTANMMGNVYEWMEDSSGVRRGGAYYSVSGSLNSVNRSTSGNLSDGESTIGFRPVVVVAEQATAPLLTMNGLNISWQSEIGWNYSVMTTTNLVVLWAPVPGWTTSGTGDMMIYTNTYTDKQRYFKVSVESQ